MATLLVIRGFEQGRRFRIDQPVVRFGRDPSNSIQLRDTEVSRQHAEIRCRNGAYSLIDLGSSNGTYINGQRVPASRPVALNVGDRIQAGQTILVFGTGETVASDDLAQKISMITQDAHDPSRSQIVKALSQEEGSRFLRADQQATNAAWLRRALADLQVMYEVSQAVSQIVDLDELLICILELTFQSIRADRGCILLLDEATRQWQWRAMHRRQGLEQDEKIEISRSIVEYVIKRRQGVRTSNAASDERFDPGGSIMKIGIQEALCAPMQGRHGLVGVIYLDSRIRPHELIERGSTAGRFTDDHLKLLIAIGHQAALAVEDTHYYQALLQAERLAAVGQTIATLSHHIKNILQGVKAGSHLIEMGLADHDQQQLQRGWKIVNKNQEKIYNLVMDMLTYSKEREPALEQTDLNELISEVVELMTAHAAETGVELSLHQDPAMPPLLVDPEGVHRAVLNIVTNAVEAAGGRQGGKVAVGTEFDRPAGKARIRVQDNGEGIDPDELPHLFTLFSSTKGAKGTGIGLAVSDKIVKEHGGRIEVQSRPGQGATFTIELPVQSNG